MKLRSIPPANRRRRTLSSMRAATRTGLVFVGSRPIEERQGSSVEFVPNEVRDLTTRTITPDAEAQEMRREFRAALSDLARKYEALIEEAASAGELVEADWWREALRRVVKE